MRAAWSLVLLMVLAGCALARPSSPVLTPKQREQAIKSYHALAPEVMRASKIEKLPNGLAVARVDVSARMRSASFGHTTTLLVPAGATSFYVELGRSTNAPSSLYGPFPIAP
ncbi:MAG TPA: hypothetical protein VII38_18640 [Polyangia bacterium]|jgi:hypothetical protein